MEERISFYDITMKLPRDISRIIGDIEEIESIFEKIEKKYPNKNGLANHFLDKHYLQLTGFHVLLISKLEYYLKIKNRIKDKEQFRIYHIIDGSHFLRDAEKRDIIYLFYSRHCIIHNGGYADKEFMKKIEKRIDIKFEDRENKDSVVLDAKTLLSISKKIKKFILSDFIGKTTEKEIRVIEREFS